jgi:hypothetical protein
LEVSAPPGLDIPQTTLPTPPVYVLSDQVCCTSGGISLAQASTFHLLHLGYLYLELPVKAHRNGRRKPSLYRDVNLLKMKESLFITLEILRV